MRKKPEQLKQMQDHYPESFCKLLSPLLLGDRLVFSTVSRRPEIRVLILGTGPVAASRSHRCQQGTVSITSCDAFSRLYRQAKQMLAL